MNVFDWFAEIPLADHDQDFNTVEVSFKNGARKAYYKNSNNLDLVRGDYVIVDAAQGYDIGEVTLQGELVKLQLKKRKIKESDLIRVIQRKAEEEDLERLKKVRAMEHEIMIKARVISRELGLDMKLGEVEYQGDGKKATFYYTAEDRVDFRELVRRYAKDFKVKIEMRQIGARQEAGRIGGIGSCGRELCCSTWLTDFKSVSTGAARYQNLSINTEKLSGQCGRLKCCLNYELDTYLDALAKFPKKVNRLETVAGKAKYIKTEIFKELMWFKYQESNTIYKLHVDDVKSILAMNKNGETPQSLEDFSIVEEVEEKDVYEDLVGQVSLNVLEEKQKKGKKRRNKRKSKGSGGQNQGGNQAQGKQDQKQPPSGQGGKGKGRNRNRGNRNRNRNKGND
jgi:cell fate regulator YaaT (PSP1 superfamily)